MSGKKTVVVAGAGFAGINLVRALNPKQFDVILVDRLNYHQFQPLLYQVAASQIEPSSISFPIRFIFRKHRNVRIRKTSVLRVEADQKKLITGIGEISYDYLVLALGCKTNYFGNEALSRNALSLKSTSDAIHIQNRILQTFEDIINSGSSPSPELLNIVIVGAGPTGVELSGAFAEIKRNVLPRDFRRIDFSALRIYLIEGSDRTLGSMSAKSQRDSLRYLERLGIEVWTDTIVTGYDGHTLTTNTGRSLPTRNVIWTAGVTANTLDGLPESSRHRSGRLLVDRHNRLQNAENIYVLGDMALMETPLYPKGHPQLANVAINQGKLLAKNLERQERGQPLRPYEYKDLGTMATIGRTKSVVDLPFIHLNGFLAWFIWMSLHLMLILSVRSKLIIFINWAWAYISHNTALRLIMEREE